MRNIKIVITFFALISFVILSGCCMGSQVYPPAATATPTPVVQYVYVTPVATPTPVVQYVYVTPVPTPQTQQPSDNTKKYLDETISVPQGYMQYISYVINAYTTVKIDVSSNSHGFTFLTFDSGNFQKYNDCIVGGEAAVWNNYISEFGVVTKSFTFTAPTTDRYYFVIDNTGRVMGSLPVKGDINVHVTVSTKI